MWGNIFTPQVKIQNSIPDLSYYKHLTFKTKNKKAVLQHIEMCSLHMLRRAPEILFFTVVIFQRSLRIVSLTQDVPLGDPKSQTEMWFPKNFCNQLKSCDKCTHFVALCDTGFFFLPPRPPNPKLLGGSSRPVKAFSSPKYSLVISSKSRFEAGESDGSSGLEQVFIFPAQRSGVRRLLKRYGAR